MCSRRRLPAAAEHAIVDRTGTVPSHKKLKSVARGASGSFASTLNYRDGDYVMGHLLRAARVSGYGRLEYDWLTGRGSPSQLLVAAVAESLARRRAKFAAPVASNGSDMAFVTSAILVVEFDLSIARPVSVNPKLLESPFTCSTTIVDERGKYHTAGIDGWWFPEA